MKSLVLLGLLLFVTGCVETFDVNGFTIEKEGEGSILLRGETIFYFNPVDVKNITEKVDYILFSYDSCDKQSAVNLMNDTTTVIGTIDCIKDIKGRTISMTNNDLSTFNFGDVVIVSVPASKDEQSGNGYVLRTKGAVFYYTSNTDTVYLINEEIDVAFLPDPVPANLMKPKFAVPIYTNSEQFKNVLKGTTVEVKLA
jgi:hypothetical protein